MLLMLFAGGEGPGPVTSSLVVETGAGLPDADSYASVAAADAYHLKRGNTAWGLLSVAAKDAALRKATDFIDQTYAGRWLGQRMLTTQALSWPRNYVPIVDGPLAGDFLPVSPLPAALVRACAELAGRAAAGTLSIDSGAAIKEKKLGPATFKYATYDSVEVARSVSDQILSGLFRRSGFGQVVAERA